jgi:SAM-dependent methyltransferase
MRAVQVPKQAISAYWNARPCGEGLARSERGTLSYFREIERAKDRLEPYVHGFAEFGRWGGADVLEVGCGVGTDTLRFARAGARVSAVDLSGTSVELTRRRLEDEGLSASVQEADAESLPFADQSFDLVYSWGVLHHTPDTRTAVDEVARVLRSGGEARIMLYNRRSFFAAAVWLRRALISGRVVSVRRALADGLESPGTRAYTVQELGVLFSSFAMVEVQTIATAYDRRVVGPVAALAPRLGWNHLVRATLV